MTKMIYNFDYYLIQSTGGEIFSSIECYDKVGDNVKIGIKLELKISQ